jgi:hypothetical protein
MTTKAQIIREEIAKLEAVLAAISRDPKGKAEDAKVLQQQIKSMNSKYIAVCMQK